MRLAARPGMVSWLTGANHSPPSLWLSQVPYTIIPYFYLYLEDLTSIDDTVPQTSIETVETFSVCLVLGGDRRG